MKKEIRFNEILALISHSPCRRRTKLECWPENQKLNSSNHISKSSNRLKSYSPNKLRPSQYLRNKTPKKTVFLRSPEDKQSSFELHTNKSNLMIDTSPSPKLNIRVKLPTLTKFNDFNDTTEGLLAKSEKKSGECKESALTNQETQTESQLGYFRKLRKSKKILLKGKDLMIYFQSFPLSPEDLTQSISKLLIQKPKKPETQLS